MQAFETLRDRLSPLRVAEYARPCRRARPFHPRGDRQDLSGLADPAPRRADRRLLSWREGDEPEFTAEDEEVPVLFAAEAGAASAAPPCQGAEWQAGDCAAAHPRHLVD